MKLKQQQEIYKTRGKSARLIKVQNAQRSIQISLAKHQEFMVTKNTR